MVLFVDAAVEPATAAAVRETVAEGGGDLSDNCLLGGRTTHAVCALHGDNAAAALLRYGTAPVWLWIDAYGDGARPAQACFTQQRGGVELRRARSQL